MKKRINDEQRDISYGEIVALQQEFETQLDERGVVFDNDEDYDEAFFDFEQQYIDGDDDPQINWEIAKVRPVRDSKRRVKDSDENSIKAAIDEMVNEYLPDLTINDYGIIDGDGLLLALADIDWCSAYVFKSEDDAREYVLRGEGADFVAYMMPVDEMVDYLSNGIDYKTAQKLVVNEDWQGIAERILEIEGAEWFLSAYDGKVYDVNGYVIYF